MKRVSKHDQPHRSRRRRTGKGSVQPEEERPLRHIRAPELQVTPESVAARHSLRARSLLPLRCRRSATAAL